MRQLLTAFCPNVLGAIPVSARKLSISEINCCGSFITRYVNRTFSINQAKLFDHVGCASFADYQIGMDDPRLRRTQQLIELRGLTHQDVSVRAGLSKSAANKPTKTTAATRISMPPLNKSRLTFVDQSARRKNHKQAQSKIFDFIVDGSKIFDHCANHQPMTGLTRRVSGRAAQRDDPLILGQVSAQTGLRE